MSNDLLAAANEPPPSRDHDGATPPDSVSVPMVSPQTAATMPIGKPTAANDRGPWGYNAQVFVISICVMALELTASRLVARSVGSSLYTWTSVIGVVLAGITLGNFLGGWLADRFDRSRSLPWMYLFGSVACASVLWMDQLMTPMHRPSLLSWPTWVLTVVAAMFLLPSLALGTISPLVASMALSRSTRVGATVGNVYAWGALGSIIGTFLTGFYLMDVWGTRTTIGLTAATLGMLAVIVAPQSRRFRFGVACAWLPVLGAMVLAATMTRESLAHIAETFGTMMTVGGERDRETARSGWASFGAKWGERIHELGLSLRLRDDAVGTYHDESNYSTIAVIEDEFEGRPIKQLLLDKLIHSYYDPDDPTALHYDYEKVYAAVTKRRVRLSARHTAADPQSVEPTRRATGLFMGGGGFIFPRWFLKEFPDSPRIEVAELDAAVYKVSIEELGLTGEEQRRILTVIGDARNFVDDRLRENQRLTARGEPAVVYDFIYGDAFNDFSIPAHLTTREFLQKVNDLLADDGVFQANIIDNYPRVEYPATTEGAAEVDYTGPLPVGLSAQAMTLGQYQSAGSRLTPLEIMPTGTDVYRLRVTATISAKDQSRLANVEITRSSKFSPLGNPIPSWMNVVESLANQTRRPKLYRGTVPGALKAANGKPRAWIPAAAPWECVEVRHLNSSVTGEGHELGFRGIISFEVENQLCRLDPDNKEWVTAVRTAALSTRHPGGPGRFLGRYVATAAKVFPNIHVFSTAKAQPGGERDTFVMVCSRRPIDLRGLADTGDWSGEWFAALETIPGQSEPKLLGQMAAVLTLAEGQILTDDFAPVDNLLKPVFADQE